MYELAIIGGGPGGVAAAIYAARKHLDTIIIADQVGGQSIVSEEIQNWIGTEKISGADLANSLDKHLRAYADDFVTLQMNTRATKVSSVSGGFSVETNKGTFEAKTALITTGGVRRKLTVPGADTYENKGITYCASCDGPLFAGQDVAVIGGGNAGFETALQLLAYCKSVTIINRGKDFRADATTVKKVLAYPNIKAVINCNIIAVTGNMFATGVTVQSAETGETITIPAVGIFVEIGMMPATNLAKDIVTLNDTGKIKVDGKTQRTSLPGIWAAGDCSDALYHQNNIAVGDAIKALEDIYLYIKAN